MKRILIVVAALTLGACVAKTSPERHSLYFARHDPTMSGGNYVSKPNDTAKLNLHIYQDVYKEGKKARATGLTLAQAQSAAEQVYESGVRATGGMETFMNLKDKKTQITPDERAARLWGQTLKDTFLDGYNGIK